MRARQRDFLGTYVTKGELATATGRLESSLSLRKSRARRGKCMKGSWASLLPVRLINWSGSSSSHRGITLSELWWAHSFLRFLSVRTHSGNTARWHEPMRNLYDENVNERARQKMRTYEHVNLAYAVTAARSALLIDWILALI